MLQLLPVSPVINDLHDVNIKTNIGNQLTSDSYNNYHYLLLETS